MLEDVYLTPRGTGRADRCWLSKYVSNYFSHLKAQGYRRATLSLYANRLLTFGEFLQQRDLREIAVLSEWVEPFLGQLGLNKRRTGGWRSTLHGFICHLIREGVVPSITISDEADSDDTIIEEYAQFLQEHRGVCIDGLRFIRRACRAFVSHVTVNEDAELKEARPEMIHRFITSQGRRYARKTVGSTCSTIRGFLRFLYRQGVVTQDLSGVVVSPRIYKHEQCPRFLTLQQIKAVLGAIDRSTIMGRRDYAMLLLLAVYGLRGIEVIRLQLEDVDWRNQRLHIRRRKAGNHSLYPLATSVGEAILVYLKLDRPASPHRNIFLTLVAPFIPLASSSALAGRVRRYMIRAGVEVDRPGTHTFRYSCAQRLFDQGTPLKSVGDYLGHHDPGTTQRYTKIAVEQLREVAIGGEVLL